MKIVFQLTFRRARTVAIRLCLSAGLILLDGPIIHAQNASAPQDTAEQREQSVAQTVLAILSYVRWPTPPVNLRLCVVGPTQYADELLKLQSSNPSVDGRRLNIGSPLLSNSCDVLYTGALEPTAERNLYAQLAGHAVLSISEADPSCDVGPMFCLNVSDRRVSFKVNLDSVARSSVRIHPSVLQLGRAKASAP